MVTSLAFMVEYHHIAPSEECARGCFFSFFFLFPFSFFLFHFWSASPFFLLVYFVVLSQKRWGDKFTNLLCVGLLHLMKIMAMSISFRLLCVYVCVCVPVLVVGSRSGDGKKGGQAAA